MKVKDLIKKLSEFNDDTQVMFRGFDHSFIPVDDCYTESAVDTNGWGYYEYRDESDLGDGDSHIHILVIE